MLDLAKEKFGFNKLIYINDIEVLLNVSNIYAKKILKKWLDIGEIRRLGRGQYYFPEKSSLFGEKPFDLDEALQEKYLGRKGDTQGYYSGLTLANMAKITTQVPNVKTIVTNKEKGKGRNVIFGKIKIRISKPRQIITEDNVAALSLLDLLEDASKYSEFSQEETNIKIQEYAKKMQISKRIIRNSLKSYPARTSKELIITGVYDVLT